jgi:hypothetical protein
MVVWDWGARYRADLGTQRMTTTTTPIRLGLKANAAQFTLLVVFNALVGGLHGSERCSQLLVSCVVRVPGGRDADVLG